jgi:DNA mismatch repair ATPase MutL
MREGVAASQGRVEVRGLEDGALPRGMAEPHAGGYGEMLRGRRAAAGGAALFDHPAYGEVSIEGPSGDRGEETTWRPESAHPRVRSGARAGAADTPFGRLIGQYRNSFLLLEDDYGLVIVDQHVAHERVLFDRIRRRLAAGDAPSQGLLTPCLIEVDEAHAGALPGVEELLRKVGIDAELFGPGTVRILSVPPEFDEPAVREVVEDVLDRATALDGVPGTAPQEIEEELAASLSCRGAIKVNHRLTVEAQRALLDDLLATDNPYRCPHGRPIILRLSQEEMERRLGRR